MLDATNKNSNPQDDLYNIDKYRRKKKRKRRTKKLLMIIIIVILIILGFFTIEGIKQKIDSKIVVNSTFPINLKGESPIDLEVIDRNIVLLAKLKDIFYNQSAKKTNEIAHRNINPSIKVKGGRILTYERNGYNLRVDSKDKPIGKLKFDNKILFAEINSNGYVGVVTFEDRFNGALTIYDSHLNQVYKYRENKKYITAFSFIGNKKGILTTQSTKDGKICSVISVLDFKKEKDTVYFEKEFIGETVYKAVYNNGKYFVYTNRAVVILDNKGKQISRYELEGRLINMENIDGRTILFMQNIVDFSKIRLLILDDENNVVSKTDITGKIEDVYYSKDRIVVLTSKDIFKYNYNLKLLETYRNDNAYREVAIIGEQIYGMNDNYLYKVQKEKVE